MVLVAVAGSVGAAFVVDAARGTGDWPRDDGEMLALAGAAVLVVGRLGLCGLVVARVVGYGRRVDRARRRELAALSRAALTDNLTGLGNHRAFHEDLRREIERRAR